MRIRDLPITPDKVLTALSDQRFSPATTRHRPRFTPHRWWISAMRWAYPRGLHALLHRYGTRLARRDRPLRSIQLRQPATTTSAVHTLGKQPGARALGGGTDLLVAREQGLRPEHVLVDLTGIPELTRLQITPTGDLVVGAAVTLAQLAEFATEHDDHVLAATIDTIASPQIRSLATVGGNLCQEKRCGYFRNGFPCYKRGGVTCPCYAVLSEHRFYHAALGAHRCQATTPSDLATTLTALDTTVHLHRPEGVRGIPITALYQGPGETVLGKNEVITHLLVPSAARRRASAFEKIRLYDGGFALVSACASLRTDDEGFITDCRAVLGGLAPTPYRAVPTEQALIGLARTDELANTACAAWTPAAHPLPGNAWKLDAGSALLARALHTALRGRGRGRLTRAS